LFFIVDYESCFFLLVVTFLIITFPAAAFLHVRIWTKHVSSNVLPCWFLVFGKHTAWFFNSLLIPGESNEKKDCDGGTIKL